MRYRLSTLRMCKAEDLLCFFGSGLSGLGSITFLFHARYRGQARSYGTANYGF
jgi:hypothetical protein